MAKKHRTPEGAGRLRLEALLAAGDLHGAGAEARRLLDEGSAAEADREAARAVLVRTRPEPGAAVAVAIGLVLYAAVALLGLLGHR